MDYYDEYAEYDPDSYFDVDTLDDHGFSGVGETGDELVDDCKCDLETERGRVRHEFLCAPVGELVFRQYKEVDVTVALATLFAGKGGPKLPDSDSSDAEEIIRLDPRLSLWARKSILAGAGVADIVACMSQALTHRTYGEVVGRNWDVAPTAQGGDAARVTSGEICAALRSWQPAKKIGKPKNRGARRRGGKRGVKSSQEASDPQTAAGHDDDDDEKEGAAAGVAASPAGELVPSTGQVSEEFRDRPSASTSSTTTTMDIGYTHGLNNKNTVYPCAGGVADQGPTSLASTHETDVLASFAALTLEGSAASRNNTTTLRTNHRSAAAVVPPVSRELSMKQRSVARAGGDGLAC